jgi:hypothetical protein
MGPRARQARLRGVLPRLLTSASRSSRSVGETITGCRNRWARDLDRKALLGAGGSTCRFCLSRISSRMASVNLTGEIRRSSVRQRLARWPWIWRTTMPRALSLKILRSRQSKACLPLRDQMEPRTATRWRPNFRSRRTVSLRSRAVAVAQRDGVSFTLA